MKAPEALLVAETVLDAVILDVSLGSEARLEVIVSSGFDGDICVIFVMVY